MASVRNLFGFHLAETSYTIGRSDEELVTEDQEHFETDVVDHVLRLYFAGEVQGKFLLPEEQPTKPQTEPEDAQSLEVAKTIAQRPSIRARICKALENGTEDIREVAKITTAVMLP